MAKFSFFQFINSLKNINASNEQDRKDIILHLTLEAMDKICPNSYMPFVFMYAASYGDLHFVHKEDSVMGIPNNLTLSFEEFSSGIINGAGKKFGREMFADKKSCKTYGITYVQFVKDLAFGVIFNELGDIFNKDDNPDYTCFWDFRPYVDSDPESEYCYPLDEDPLNINDPLLSTIKTLEKVDPFFNTVFDKASYFVLIGILKRCIIATPGEEYTYDIIDINDAMYYYRDWDKWHNYYDSLIMQKFYSQKKTNATVPNGLTRIVNGLFFDAQRHPMYAPFTNMGAFALNVNAQMAVQREQKTPNCFYSDIKDDETVCATTVRLLFRDCIVIWTTPDEDIKGNTYYVAMPSLTSKFSNSKADNDILKREMAEGMEYACKGSKMACIVPSYVLVSENFLDIRKKIVDSKYKVKIISLPKETVSEYDSAISIIFIDGREESDSVKFIDGFDYVSRANDEDSLNAIDSIPRKFQHPDVGNIYINYTSVANLCFHDEYPENDEESDKGAFMFGAEIWNENCTETDNVATDEFGDRIDFRLSKESFEHDTRIIKKESILANATMNPSYYFNRPVVAPIGYEVCRLSEVLMPIYNNALLPNKGKIVSSKDLRNADFTYEVDVPSLPVKTVQEGYLVIDKPSVLMSKLGQPRPSLLKSSETVFADTTLRAFCIVTSKAHAEYLVSEMRKEDLAEQIRSANIERGIFKYRGVTLNALKIYMPLPTKEKKSLEVQKDIVDEEISSRFNELSGKYKQLSDQRFNEYIMALRQRKHRLSQILNQVCPAFNLLNRTRERKNGVLRDTDIVASRTGENVAQYFGKVQAGLDKIERLIETFVDKNNWGKSERFVIDDFVDDFAKNHICKNYQIIVSKSNIACNEGVDNNGTKVDHLVVNMPKDELSTVLENIIANAETWGFNDNNRKDYYIRITLGDSEDGDGVIIRIANNGTPIHPSVDREHIFDWGVGSHTGVGTWQAKNIVEHYGGQICINEYPQAKDGFQTEYEITLQREY